MPPAEVDVTVELAEQLITEQHPDLLAPLTMITHGWDNVILRLGEDLVVRIPRRQLAAQLVINEQRWLPTIADRVPVAIPVPVRVGEPSADYPWNWTITRWLDGRPLIDLPVADRSGDAVALADFFAALHRPAPAEAPTNPVRGVPLAERSGLVASQLATGLVPDEGRVRTLWADLVTSPVWTREPSWVHGDPHPANFLHREHPAGGAGLSAVIDFGDITAGDPATDLASAWLTFDRRGRQLFIERYSEATQTDHATWRRARGWALSIGLSLLVNSDDHPRLSAAGRHALRQVLAGT